MNTRSSVNYIRLFTDEWFLNSYRNNIVFTVVTVPALLALGLVIAVSSTSTYGAAAWSVS